MNDLAKMTAAWEESLKKTNIIMAKGLARKIYTNNALLLHLQRNTKPSTIWDRMGWKYRAAKRRLVDAYKILFLDQYPDD